MIHFHPATETRKMLSRTGERELCEVHFYTVRWFLISDRLTMSNSSSYRNAILCQHNAETCNRKTISVDTRMTS